MQTFDMDNVTQWIYPGIAADYALRCVGDCMQPTFNEGEYVLIHRQPTFADGQVVAARVNGRLMLKRAYRTQGGVIFCMDNKKYLSFTAVAADVEILGIVVAKGAQHGS